MLQRTIAGSIFFDGNSLHRNEYSRIKLGPAGEDSGVIFVYRGEEIGVSSQNLVGCAYQMVLKGRRHWIFSVEHLLSGLYGVGVDNCRVEVLASSELPVLDGSAGHFIEVLTGMGLIEQGKEVRLRKIERGMGFVDGGRLIFGFPSLDLRVNCLVSDRDCLLEEEFYSWKDWGGSYIEEISRARTFGFLSDYGGLKSRGYARGSSSRNTLILTNEKYLNGVRGDFECARHKILDFLGALSCLEGRVLGEFYLYRSGHYLDMGFVKRLDKILNDEGYDEGNDGGDDEGDDGGDGVGGRYWTTNEKRLRKVMMEKMGRVF